MRVKIGEEWYDSEEEPICLQVTEMERDYISSLEPSKTPNMKFAVFPEWQDWSENKRREWMQEPGDITPIEELL